MSRGRGAGYLLDSSNLHVGGGIQVGASVVNELAGLRAEGLVDDRLSETLDLLVSPEVAANLEPTTWATDLRISVGSSTPTKWASLPRAPYRSIFTLFGPHYRPRQAEREIVGFALGLLIYPLAEAGLQPPSPKQRLLNVIRWMRFQSADVLVTETEDSALRVAARVTGARLEVVPNCVSRAVSDRRLWMRADGLSQIDEDSLTIAAIGRDYPHKNLRLLPHLGSELQVHVGRKVRFLVTLTEDEWRAKEPGFRNFCINCGVVTQRELGYIYESSQATVFPSLLEISSATPLESMSLGVPVFVSDIPAMRSAYGEAAVYFDPWDSGRAAESIAPHLAPGALAQRGRTVLEWSEQQPDPRGRALRYLEVLQAG